MAVEVDVLPISEVAPPAFDSPTVSPAEIDVRKLLDGIRSLSTPASGTPANDTADFSLECCVDWVAAEDRHPVLVEACPVCGNDSAEPRFAISGVRYRLVECTDCGLGRLHPRPDTHMIGRFYPPSYYGITGAKFIPLVEALVRLVGARRVRALSKGLPRGARVLDVGCGRGVLLAALADRGFDVHGFEISAAAAAGADPRATIRVGRDLADVRYPDAFFDQVIVWHVFEHLPDPRATLREFRRILKPGGRLVIAVPNYGSWQARWSGPAWFHLDLPRHLFHFPVEGLRRLLSETGFACRSEHHFSLRQNPFGWVQSALNRHRALPRNGLYTLLKSQTNPGSLPFSRTTRAAFRAAYWLGMPVACVLSVVEALLRRGASVCVVAEARCD